MGGGTALASVPKLAQTVPPSPPSAPLQLLDPSAGEWDPLAAERLVKLALWWEEGGGRALWWEEREAAGSLGIWMTRSSGL